MSLVDFIVEPFASQKYYDYQKLVAEIQTTPHHSWWIVLQGPKDTTRIVHMFSETVSDRLDKELSKMNWLDRYLAKRWTKETLHV